MRIQTSQFLTFVCALLINCTSRHKSEIADAPCVIIKPESHYVVLGNYYKAHIILICDKPDSLKQINIRTDLKGETYLENGNIYWQYRGAQAGEVTFKGEVEIKSNDGNIRKFPFEDKFYSALPNSVITNNKLNYLIRGEENSVSVAAPGFPCSVLKVTARNANIQRDTSFGNEYAIYKVKPSGTDPVSLTTYINKYGRQVHLGSHEFNVVNKVNTGKN